MPIPQNRAELLEAVESTFAKLWKELQAAGPPLGALPCVDDWNVRELLVVRAWWTYSVVDWIEAGRRGEQPVTPAPGYRWKDTPRLNAGLVEDHGDEPYESVLRRLRTGYERILALIEALEDDELFEAGRFAWAGKYPVARWISMNTARQYTTARTYVRKALRAQTED